MEVTIGESKTRQSAQQYLKVEQNTQYLTHLIRYSTNKRRVHLRQDMNPPDLKSIAALTVQFSYLLFTCCVKQVTVLISRKFMLLNPLKREVNPQICCQYILQKDFLTLREQQQNIIQQNYERHEFSTSDMRAYGKYTLIYMKIMIEIVKSQIQRLKSAADKILAKQFLNLQAIKNFLETRLPSIQHPRIVILCFQQSELFRQYSILVKIMNNSIFSTIKNSKYKSIFTQICAMQYNLSKSKDKNKTFLETYSLEIQATIQELMKILIKFDVIKVQQSIINGPDKNNAQDNLSKMGTMGPMKNIGPGGPTKIPNMQMQAPLPNPSSNYLNEINKSAQQTSKPYLLGDVEDMNLPDRKYFCKVQLYQKPWRQFTPNIYQALKFQALNNYNTSQGKMQDENQNKQQKDQKQISNTAKNQFVIEYSPVKGLLVVKYITPIQLNIENTDFVMFQCNNIAYHWSQVSMELVEKSANKSVKKKERFLALKTITHLHIADRPLFKLLLMLDLVMLCAKIAEPELKRNIIKAQDYNRIEQISLKVNHMINLFIRKVERYYKILSESENSIQNK